MTPVRLEPAALRSRVKRSTTEPLRSPERVITRLQGGGNLFGGGGGELNLGSLFVYFFC